MLANNIPQNSVGVKTELYQENRADILALADIALQKYRAAWGRFLASGDDRAYVAAVAAWGDREQLLGEVSLCHKA